MGPQRYERVSEIDHDDDNRPMTPPPPPHTTTSDTTRQSTIPSSPPPSFRSRASSPANRPLLAEDPIASDADRTLSDAFDNGYDSDTNGDDGEDGRQRLMRGNLTSAGEDNNHVTTRPGVERAVTEFPRYTPAVPNQPNNRVVGSGGHTQFTLANDGVFANLNAKPELGEKEEEQPPSYEQAAADATPPYWENTILTPGLTSGDEVYVDGLPVGSLFSFVWNGMISMSFQLVGFLLTYLLHTTHAAKNGSRAGLGITLVQYGFYMRSSATRDANPLPEDPQYGQPMDPNNPNFDPSQLADSAAAVAAMAQTQAKVAAENSGSSTGGGGGGGLASLASSEWFAYVLMIVGWFILIRAVSDYFKARRHEQLVLQSPDRGASGIAEGERAETVV